MKKTTEKKNHGKKIIMHLKRHHMKYLFGAFGGFAIVKTILLFFGLGPVLNIGNIFAGSEDPIILNASNFNDYCSTGYAYESLVDITCTGGIEKVESGAFSEYSNIRWLYLSGNNISEIEAGAFSGLTIETLDLSYNKLSNIDFEVFSGSTITTLDISHNQIYEVSNPETINDNNTTVDISYNCLPNSMIGEIENKMGDTDQFACFYVEYQPTTWTNSGVQATLSVTGNDEIVNEISSLTTLITFNDNGAEVINFGDTFLSNSGNILNYPEDSQTFPAYVNWIDKTDPYVSFDVMNGTGKSITVILSGNDDDSGLQDNSDVYYKIGDSSCSDDDWMQKLLENNQYLSLNIDSLDDGTYYLCVKEDSLSDKAGNGNKATQAGPFTLDNTAPNCTRGNPSSGSLQIGETGNVTLTCSDTNGILTDNLSSTDIEHSEDVITLSNAEIENNDGNISYTFVYTAVGSGNTSLILKTGVVQDNAGNGNTGGAFVEISVHDEQQAPTGPLVYFEKQPSGNWVSQQDITIVLTDGATGCYRHQTITGSRQSGNCRDINSGSVQLSIIHEHRNNGYICAFWQSGFYTGFVCSDHPILVDPSNPSIELLGPVNGTSVNLGDSITLSWSGSDNKSGLSGYELAIQKPNSGTGYSYYNSGVTSTGFTVDQTGTRFWSVTAYDNVGRQESSSGWSVVVLNGNDSPEILGDLVSFDGEKKPHGNWVSQQDIKIVRTGGATGCIAYSDNTGTFDGCDDVYSGEHSFTIDYEDHNNEYICASWQSGFYTGFVCSDDPVLVDRSNPNIELSGPANGTSVYLGDTITLSWSGSDDESGLSGYKLTIQEPNNNTGFSYYNSGETSTGFIVDQTGTRFWSVTAYDNVGNEKYSDEWFFGVLSGDDSPEILGDLVSFEKKPSGNWSQSEEIIIHWQDGATGGYLIKDNNNTSILWNEDSYTGSNGNNVTLTFTDENNNGKYVCAFGQTGEHITTICTDHPILVDTIDPTCSTTWTYVPNSGNTNGWSNTEITATLSDSTDEGGSEILTSGGSCIIESGENSTCTVTISDNAGNTTSCISSGFNIDTQAPIITLDNQSGAASNSHSVKVTITDDIAGFEENSLIRYKWQIDGDSCDTDNYNSEALSNSGGALEITTTISTSNLSDGTYYLCISGAQDQAGNQSETTKTDGVFVVDNTKPGCTRGNPSSGSLQKGQTGSITLTCSDTNGILTDNLSSTDIEHSEDVITLSNAEIENNDGNISYTFVYTAVGPGNTSLILKTGVVQDNAGNGNTGVSSAEISVSAVIDTQAPTISFNKTGGSPATSHEVIVTATDNGSKLAANQTVKYRRSTSETCGTEGFTEVELTPTEAGSDSAIATISTNDLSDGNYYLCILSGTVEDRAGNQNEAARTQGVFIVDNTKPICERSGLSTNSLEMGQTGNITLRCTDNLAGIQTMNITSGNISFSSGGVLQINNISTGSIAGGVKYDIEFQAIGSGTTTLTLKANSVKDNANNGNPAGIISDGISVNDNNGNNHNSPESLIEISGLVTIDGPSGNRVNEDTVEIHWNSGATGGYLIKNNKNSDIEWNDVPYTGSNGGSVTLTFTGESNNSKYICAFGQTGGYITSICSNYPIRVDRSNPNIQLLSPANGTTFNFGDSITLSWSGSDGKSGISGYVLAIKRPNNNTGYYYYNSGTTSTRFTLNQTGTRFWSVTAYDNTAHYITRVGTFVVQQNGGGGDTPVPGVLVSFGRQPSGNWTDGETIIINWHNGATGGYRYQTSTGSRQAGSYTQVSSGSATLNIRDENHNKYICAYGQTGGYTGFICSTHPVKVDITNPSLSLVYPDPSVSYDFKKGTNIRFVWSGNDDRSGISGYVFDVVSPSGSHDPHNFGSNTTAYTKTLNETGRRYWYVTGYDNTNHRIYKSGSFYVSEDGGIPENGFYLISPALGAQINLGNNVVLSWNPGTVNSGYIWTVKKISGTTIATGTTTGLTATVNSGKFSTGAYSRSVKDIATDTTKSIPLFYIIDNSDAPDLEVNPFEFNEVENADLDEYYSSNRITIRGLSDDWYTLAYLGSGIGALYINGQFVGTSGYVQNGDKVYIEMKASDEYNKTVKTTLFVGVGSNTVSGDFKITTKDGIHDWDDSSLTPMQKLWGVIYVDSLVEMYQYDEKKLATFLSTFMQLLQDKSDYYASKIQEAEEDGDEELAKEYKLYKEAIDFLYITVKYRYDHLDVEDHTIYIAPNGKQYLIEYDEDRMAYTSPDFVRTKYFPTWELLTNHIDINNPAVGKWGIVGNVITTHNGKVYTIYEKNGKWTSSNFKTAKYFDTKEDIINHILANNPASDWDHKIDTDFDEVKHTAPNGRVYKIFKTSSKGNNPNMYSSYDFVNAKYFTSLEAAKKFINQNNPK